MQQQPQQQQKQVEVFDAQFDYYGKRLATGSSDGIIRIYALVADEKGEEENLKQIGEAKGHEAAVFKVGWSSPKFGNGLLASSGYDRRVIIWRENRPPVWEKVYLYEGHELSVNSVAFAPYEYGLCVASASSDGTIALIQHKDGEWSVQRFMAHHTGVNAISWAPYKEAPSLGSFGKSTNLPPAMRLASAGCDGLVKIWRLEHGQFLCEEALQGKTEAGVPQHGWVRAVAWCPSDEATIASAQGNVVTIWRYSDRSRQAKPLPPFSDEVMTLSWSQTGQDIASPILAITLANGQVSIWQEKKGVEATTTPSPPSSSSSSSSSTSSPLLAARIGGVQAVPESRWECISGLQSQSAVAPPLSGGHGSGLGSGSPAIMTPPSSSGSPATTQSHGP
jgi:protein transport protein SEC13